MKKATTPEYGLDMDEVAERFNVTRMTVWSWTKKRMIAYTRIGRSYRFSERDVAEFLQRGRFEYEAPKEALAETVPA